VVRARVEPGRRRGLVTVFGEVTVTRMAYRAPGAANLHPADAALNLPEEKHSHGVRKLAAIESARGRFESAYDQDEVLTFHQCPCSRWGSGPVPVNLCRVCPLLTGSGCGGTGRFP
jgi:hypothetical protein